MSIVFYNRNFVGTIQLDADIDIERYSHHMIGGPDTATLKIKVNSDKWELAKLLRCPVEIYGEDGGCKWWGYVNRVVIPHGKIRVGLGLDALYNSISIKHSTGTTSVGLDTQSVSEYGTKEFFINLSGSTSTEAASYRDTYLADHKYAMPEIELTGGDPDIVVECYGWWRSLQWKYYTNAGTGTVENTTQIAAMVTSCGQFLNGTIIENTAGVSSVETRTGTNNAMNSIVELLNAGTSNARRLLAYVDKNRWLHIWEQPAETTQYVMRDDGKLEELLGNVVDPENCIHAVWVRLKDVPHTLGGVSSMRPFFIERAVYVENTSDLEYS